MKWVVSHSEYVSLSRATGILDKMVAWTESTPVNLCLPIFSCSQEFSQSCLYNSIETCSMNTCIYTLYMLNEFGLIIFSNNFWHNLCAWLGCTYNNTVFVQAIVILAWTSPKGRLNSQSKRINFIRSCLRLSSQETWEWVCKTEQTKLSLNKKRSSNAYDMAVCNNLELGSFIFWVLSCFPIKLIKKIGHASSCTVVRNSSSFLRHISCEPGGGTPYNGLYGEAPPERGAFFRLQVYKRVGISQV